MQIPNQLARVAEIANPTNQALLGGFSAMEQTASVIEMDTDEREKLNQEWEARLNEIEIRASLERARFSRDIRELARRNEELEKQFSNTEDGRETNGTDSRRWLAKFGLN